VRTDAQRYFRTTPDGRLLAKGSALHEHEYSNHSANTMAKFQFMLDHGRIPDSMKTRKFAQRVLPERWGSEGPNVTATSLPDDYVHFRQPRVPTVREWARIQTFPDWYQFAGYRTTGGRRRAGDPSAGIWTRELPKYTQIGNAVPVQMGREVGKHLLKLVESI
jgi:DNA (cytosine-5)-methyltransferase 1